jgi:hypothetical protein
MKFIKQNSNKIGNKILQRKLKTIFIKRDRKKISNQSSNEIESKIQMKLKIKLKTKIQIAAHLW